MPRDKRLYMTFPIDIHRHPKMQRLSPAAKWAFVEMNGEARIAGNDGRFSADDAEYLWSSELLGELLASHPSRPVVVRDGSDYVIRDYAEHQQTAAAVADLSSKRAAAGRKGAEQTNGKRAASAAALAEQVDGNARQASAESESEKNLTDMTTSHSQVYLGDARVDDADRIRVELDDAKRQAVVDADTLGIRDLADTRDLIESRLGYPITLGQTVELCRWIVSKARHEVRDGGAYVGTVVRKSPAKVRDMATQLDLGSAA